MALPKPFSRLRRALRPSKQLTISGFTLLELLVAMIVSSIVVSGLLYLVVELLKTDRRESVLDQTQRDMQRAIDYIGDDIREAVFLYDDPSVLSTQITDLPSGATPILAFWRPDPITNGLPICSTAFSGDPTKLNQCEVLRVRQSAYSLVMYLQKPKDGNANWPGKSRIIRYKLDKYKNLANLESTPGYRDPASQGVSFRSWTRLGASTAGNSSVLVDFVDEPVPSSPLASPPSCTHLGAGYSLVPSTASTTNTSFFSCIRNPNAVDGGGGNQDAYLFLRGNIDGAGSGLGPIGRDSALPTLETRVLMRGVIDKNPAN